MRMYKSHNGHLKIITVLPTLISFSPRTIFVDLSVEFIYVV